MKKIRVAASGDVKESQVHAVQANGQSVLLTRVQGKVCAISSKCTHMGLSMKKGKIVDGAIQCPWHGSKFDVCTGKNVNWTNSFLGIPMPRFMHGMIAMGKKPAPVPTFTAVEEEGTVFVEMPDA
ncbi:MAG: Rieske 2Fe-2S domain-containing protein [Rugosibacter sp.]|jgi:nitrite reductase/ring-hydroxylating ferredoxin subunit|nr:hypothetical protein [Rugosibacter sp.]